MNKPIVSALAIVLSCLVSVASADLPRMDSGKPDFSGTYDITSLTPFTRDPNFGEKMTFTRDEVGAIKRRSHNRVNEAAARVAADRASLRALQGAGRDRGVDNSGSYTPGSYDFHWFDCGGIYCDLYQIDGAYRTSVIIDPPNGQMPSISASGKARRATLRPHYHAKYPGDAW